jgi:LPS-assembly protein
MRNNFYKFLTIIILTLSFNSELIAKELKINSNEVKLNKKSSEVIFNGDVKAVDENNNTLISEKAKYKKNLDFLESIGDTKIITNQNYIFLSQNVQFDNKRKVIKSSYPTTIFDPDGNEIQVEMFNYNSINNILFSKGNIQLKDKNKNTFKFSEIYIEEKSKKIIGSDAKLFFTDNNFKADPRNNPRIFANSVAINKNSTNVQKGVITFCQFREGDKCPPWELQAQKIRHNNTKKTIYYDNAILKIYDFPIFYFPKLSHPDPTVTRRSGFLVPSFTNSSNVGFGADIPYFWNIANDKDITFTPRFYADNNPLYLAEYRQDFEKSFLILDSSYTKGYKKITNNKTPGSRSHIFTKFYTSFIEKENHSSDLEVNLQHVSNSTYPKINKLQTELVDYLDSTLKNTIDYSYQKEDLFFNSSFSAFENLSKTGNDKWEYIYPEASLEKNIFMSEDLGIVDLKSELLIKNFEVDKQIEVVSNQFNWVSISWINKFGFENEFLGLAKNINYNAKDAEKYKTDSTVSEFYGALGFKSELGLFKIFDDRKLHVFKPKFLLRLSPDDSRDISDNSSNLNFANIFNLNKINTIDEVDTGSSLSLGFDFKINNINEEKSVTEEKFSFGLGQIINEKENSNMPAKSTLNQRFSDIVGETKYNFNSNLSVTNNFLLDQNLEDLNKNKIDLDLIYPKTSFNLGYLEEKQHIGNQKYVQSKIGFNTDQASISLGAKRNLLTNSAEFYDLSYEYINDCLRAGFAFRREFYRDRDLEPEDSLIFKITFTPLGAVNTPALN